jgi:hypothetical protein
MIDWQTAVRGLAAKTRSSHVRLIALFVRLRLNSWRTSCF